MIYPSEMSSCREVTRLLPELANGSESALGTLTPLKYAELRRLAESCMNSFDHTGHRWATIDLENEEQLHCLAAPRQLLPKQGRIGWWDTRAGVESIERRRVVHLCLACITGSN